MLGSATRVRRRRSAFGCALYADNRQRKILAVSTVSGLDDPCQSLLVRQYRLMTREVVR